MGNPDAEFHISVTNGYVIDDHLTSIIASRHADWSSATTKHLLISYSNDSKDKARQFIHVPEQKEYTDSEMFLISGTL